MPRLHRSFGPLFCAVVGVIPSVASAWFTVNTVASAKDFTTVNLTNTDPFASLEAEVVNDTGGHGYAEGDLDFGGGIITGRTHGCVGPVRPVTTDRAGGTTDAGVTAEMIVARSDSLVFGAAMTVTICYSITSNVYGTTSDPALTSSGTSDNSFGIAVNGQSVVSASHGIDFGTQVIESTGAFAGAASQTATIMGTYDFVVANGIPFALTVSASSHASANARSALTGGLPTLVSGSAGFAMTFGLHATDASFTWGNLPWKGTCGGSEFLVPPNPVEPDLPAPSTLLAFVGAAPLAARRRR